MGPWTGTFLLANNEPTTGLHHPPIMSESYCSVFECICYLNLFDYSVVSSTFLPALFIQAEIHDFETVKPPTRSVSGCSDCAEALILDSPVTCQWPLEVLWWSRCRWSGASDKSEFDPKMELLKYCRLSTKHYKAIIWSFPEIGLPPVIHFFGSMYYSI